MDASDQILLRDFLGGREQAFRELSDRHVNLVYGVAMRNLADPSIAEEVVQDVFVLLAKKAKQLAGHPCIAGWLHNTSRNVARDARRKRVGHQKKLQHFAEAGAAEQAPGTPAPVADHEEIDSAVEALPAKEREAILLRFFEDRDYREIAHQLAISEPAARKRVSRGIERLHSGLSTKLAAGTALAIVAPAHLGEVVASHLPQTAATPLASSVAASKTIAPIIMTKQTVTITCAAILIGGLGWIAFDQNAKRKRLASEVAELKNQLAAAGNTKKKISAAGSFPADPVASAQQTKIRQLEEELSTEREGRLAAEKEVAALREATAGLEDEVVLAFGKVEEIGTDFGSIFKEARALSEIEQAGELDTDENKKRLIRFQMKAASISGLSKQIIEFDDTPDEGSQFFASTYKSIFDLDDASTKALQAVFEREITVAKERGLTLVNNPALKMLSGEEQFSEKDIEEWLNARQEYYRGFRERVREQVPASKHAEFDRTVEQDGIGFMNITLGGSPLGFSLGGKQPAKGESETDGGSGDPDQGENAPDGAGG